FHDRTSRQRAKTVTAAAVNHHHHVPPSASFTSGEWCSTASTTANTPKAAHLSALRMSAPYRMFGRSFDDADQQRGDAKALLCVAPHKCKKGPHLAVQPPRIHCRAIASTRRCLDAPCAGKPTIAAPSY